MYFESVQVLDGKLIRWEYHLQRILTTVPKFQYHYQELERYVLPYSSGLYKLRIDYHKTIEKLEIQAYQRKTHKCVALQEVDFNYYQKWANRQAFTQALLQNPDADDVIFTQNNAFLDSTYCNLAFRKNEHWYTPETYLLKGTKRQFLLDTQQLIEAPIGMHNLHQFEQLAFINAMRDFEDVYTFSLEGNRIHLLSANSDSF